MKTGPRYNAEREQISCSSCAYTLKQPELKRSCPECGQAIRQPIEQIHRRQRNAALWWLKAPIGCQILAVLSLPAVVTVEVAGMQERRFAAAMLDYGPILNGIASITVMIVAIIMQKQSPRPAMRTAIDRLCMISVALFLAAYLCWPSNAS